MERNMRRSIRPAMANIHQSDSAQLSNSVQNNKNQQYVQLNLKLSQKHCFSLIRIWAAMYNVHSMSKRSTVNWLTPSNVFIIISQTFFRIPVYLGYTHQAWTEHIFRAIYIKTSNAYNRNPNRTHIVMAVLIRGLIDSGKCIYSRRNNKN